MTADVAWLDGGFGGDGGPVPDRPVSDRPSSDLPVPDLPVPDGPVPDLEMGVADLPMEAPQPDLPLPDASGPDLPVPDLPSPDLPPPDLPLPDLPPPDLPPPDQTFVLGDAMTDAATAFCAAKFGAAPDYILCWVSPSGCAFNVTTNGTCNSMCQSLGTSCLAAWDNPNSSGQECNIIGQDSCGTSRGTEICLCSK